ncbi:MAG: HlyD family efflux transporter periplasmic adaptor subunit [Bacteroidetes bacterium]|nr:HlyD family efflux transporter periplasmic adaptor subunit [Bacteroidota bacterium]
MKKTILFAALIASITSCNNNKNNFDAAGAFESVETIVSTEASGTIKEFKVEEGQTLQPGQFIGYVDSIQLYLKKKQLEAQIKAVLSGRPDSEKQIAVLEEQLKNAEREQKRFTNLLQANAGTQKQLDDINAQIEVIKKQIEAQKSTLGISSANISEQAQPLQRQIEQINDQISKCRIINPIHGTVLTKYAQDHEVVMPGKALYKIAETDTLILRAYITGSQLSEVKLGQTIKVRVDKGAKQYGEYSGIVYWVSDRSEFTPKTIPTKEERADLVYAIRVRVINDGFLKIGMYAEVQFK